MKGVKDGRVVHYENTISSFYKESFGFQNGGPVVDGKIEVSYEKTTSNSEVMENLKITYGPAFIGWSMPLLKSDTTANLIEWNSKKGLSLHLEEPKSNTRMLDINDLDDRVLACLEETPPEVKQCLAKFVNGYRA